MLACGIAGLIYLLLSSGIRVTSVKALVMALAYAWGLILAIYLMGHGLVALPRRLIRNANISVRLKGVQARAPKVYERLMEAIEELDQLESQVVQLRQKSSGAPRALQEWIDELVETSTLPEARVVPLPSARVAHSAVPAVITERYLADLSRKLKRARHKRARFVDEWNRLLQEASDLQTILDASGSRRLDFGKASQQASSLGMISILTPYTRYHVYTHVLPAARYLLGGFFALASICIIWSEVAKSISPKLSIIAYTVVHHPNSDRGQIGFVGQCIAAAWILYMCFSALVSLSEVKVWGNRALVKRNTYAESACWYSYQVAKLTVPLSYNFITFMDPLIFKKTTFYKFLGRLINLTSLGSGFSKFFPIFILFPVCATLFNLYGKVKHLAGFGVMEEEEDGGWREGRALIQRELQGNSSLHLSNRGQYGSPSTSGTNTPTRSGGLNLLSNHRNVHDVSLRPANTPSTRRKPLTSEELPPDEEGEGSFFADFGHRLKNTFDTADTPKWMSNLGGGFKKPKWMGGEEGNTGSGGRPDFGARLGSLFGGGSSDGRVRL